MFYTQGIHPGLLFDLAIKKKMQLNIALCEESIYLSTLEGDVVARAGDYITVDVLGNQYVIRKENKDINFDNVQPCSEGFKLHSPDKENKVKFLTATRKTTTINYHIMEYDFCIHDDYGDMYGNKGDVLALNVKNGNEYYMYPINIEIFKLTYNPIIMGVYVGRFSPIHKGHINVLNTMHSDLPSGGILTLIGSSVSKLDNRLFYTYKQRRDMILDIYPQMSICGLPDYKYIDKEDTKFTQWHVNLWDIIKLKLPIANVENVLFYSGSKEDSYFYEDAGYNVKIIDRESSGFSATEVRSCLMNTGTYRHLQELVHEKSIKNIVRYFKENKNKILENYKT